MANRSAPAATRRVSCRAGPTDPIDDDLKSQGNYLLATGETINKDPSVESQVLRANFSGRRDTSWTVVLKRPFRFSVPMTDGVTAGEPRAPESL